MAENINNFPSRSDFKHFMKRFGKLMIMVVGIVLVVILAFNSIYTIKEQEQAVVTTFGIPKTVGSAGLHFKIPFIQNVSKVDTTIQGFSIGYDKETNKSIEEESMMITKDFNFVNVDFFVEYKVADPVKALYASQEPIAILKSIAQSSIRMVVGSYDVDSVITTGKYEIQSEIKASILKKLEKQDIGIQLVNITIQDSEPPTEEVMKAFKSVETAKQGADTAINTANKYKNEKLPEADAKVDKILQQAEATKTERINEANAEVARFNKMYTEYKKFPLVTKQRMFYEAMEDVLPSLKVVIDDSKSGVQKIMPLDSFTEGVTKK